MNWLWCYPSYLSLGPSHTWWQKQSWGRSGSLLLWIRFGMLEINSFFQGHVSQPMEIVNQICHQVVAVDLSIKSNQAITTQEESRGSNSIII